MKYRTAYVIYVIICPNIVIKTNNLKIDLSYDILRWGRDFKTNLLSA